MKLVERFRTAWRLGIIGRSARRVERRIQRHEAGLERMRRHLESRIAAISARIDQAMTDLESARKTQRAYESELDAVRNQLRIAEEVTIPTLTAAHKLLLSRYDAETAIQVRRQVASGTIDTG